MAEYYPLLSKAVSGLRDGPPERRQAIYDRARQALLGQLRSMEQANEELIDRERRALDDAIGQLEMEIGMAAALGVSASPAPTPAPPESPPATARRDGNGGTLAPPRPAPALTRSPSARPASAPLPPRPYAMPPKPTVPPRPAAAATGQREKISAIGSAPSARAPRNEAGQAVVSLPVAPRLELKPREAEVDNQPESFDKALEEAGTAADTGSRDFPLARSGDQQSVRPAAPRALERREKLNPWVLFVGIFAALVVIGIGYAAWRLRDKPEALARAAAAKRAAQMQDQQQPGKIVNRADDSPPTIAPDQPTNGEPAGGAQPSSPDAPAPASANPPQIPPPSTDNQTAPAATPPSDQAPAPATTQAPSAPVTPVPTPDSSTAAPAVDNPAIAVSQRAAFLVGAPNDANNVQTFVGTVVWTKETTTPPQGQAAMPAIRAEVDIPDAKLKLSMLIQKNVDDKVSASHMIELRFTPQPGNTLGDIQAIEVPAMRADDAPVGDPLSGTRVRIGTNYFWVGLARGSDVARNVDLLQQRNWFDIPCRLGDNRIAKITFEKGASGAKLLGEAIQSWQ